MGFLHEDLTRKIIKACFTISNEIGCGFVEQVYQNALAIELQIQGLQCAQQVPLKVYYRNQEVGSFFADMIVEGKVLLELKAVKQILPEHVAQIINYIYAGKIDVGFLINFGKPRLDYRRFDNEIGEQKRLQTRNRVFP